jgi:hypothetical protein
MKAKTESIVGTTNFFSSLSRSGSGHLLHTTDAQAIRTFSANPHINVDNVTQHKVDARIQSLKTPVSPSSLNTTRNKKTLAEAIFDATAHAKISTSQIAMYLDNKWRKNIFEQLDLLHDLNNWDDDLNPVNNASTQTFLRTIVNIKPKAYPSLGLSTKGNLVAAWTTGKKRLTVEFLPKDKTQWIFSQPVDGETERAAGITTVNRLFECIKPYNIDDWFTYKKA